MADTVLWRNGLSFPPRAFHASRQSGVVLIIALVVLVAMTLASIAMVRSVDTSTMISGNLAFKQGGAAAGDFGVEAAIAWLEANSGSLEQDSPANAYYATRQSGLDITGSALWSDASSVRTLADEYAGNKVSYVIHRMCNEAGPPDSEKCTTESTVGDDPGRDLKDEMREGGPGLPPTLINRSYYRITVRSAGPRNNVSFIQAIVLF